MIFVDYIGPAERYRPAREVVAREVAAAMRSAPGQVQVRRIVTEDQGDVIELWVELSSDEQLYRLGRNLARRVTEALREVADGASVWVLFRVVPRSHAFLDGEPRGRGAATFE